MPMARRVFPARLALHPRSPQGSTPGEGQLNHRLAGLSGADNASAEPYGYALWGARLDPFALLSDARVRRVDKAANIRQGLCAPAPETESARLQDEGPPLRSRARHPHSIG